MNCLDARETFSDHFDGTLSSSGVADLQGHLDGCPACRAEWAVFRRTVRALRGTGDEAPSSGFTARVIERIEARRWWQRVVTTLVFPLRVKLPIHATALVALGLAGLWASQRSPELQRATVERAPSIAERRTEAARTMAPPAGSKTTTAEQPAPSSAATAASEKPTPPSAATTPPPATPADKDAGLHPRAREEAEMTLREPAIPPTVLPQLHGDAPGMGRPQTGPPPPEARARIEPTPRPEAGVSAMQRRAALPARRSADELLSTGVEAFAAQRYEPAIDALRDFLSQHPDDGRAPEARFLLADAYRAQGRYAVAGVEFGEFLRRYPEHPRAPIARYRRGEIQLLLGDHSGCTTLRDAVTRHPDAREAASARDMLAARCP